MPGNRVSQRDKMLVFRTPGDCGHMLACCVCRWHIYTQWQAIVYRRTENSKDKPDKSWNGEQTCRELKQWVWGYWECQEWSVRPVAWHLVISESTVRQHTAVSCFSCSFKPIPGYLVVCGKTMPPLKGTVLFSACVFGWWLYSGSV